MLVVYLVPSSIGCWHSIYDGSFRLLGVGSCVAFVEMERRANCAINSPVVENPTTVHSAALSAARRERVSLDQIFDSLSYLCSRWTPPRLCFPSFEFSFGVFFSINSPLVLLSLLYLPSTPARPSPLKQNLIFETIQLQPDRGEGNCRRGACFTPCRW